MSISIFIAPGESVQAAGYVQSVSSLTSPCKNHGALPCCANFQIIPGDVARAQAELDQLMQVAFFWLGLVSSFHLAT
jgi:hypothetical protein